MTKGVPMKRLWTLVSLMLAVSVATAGTGTISIAWDPVTNAAGYRVFVGKAAGSYTLPSVDVTTPAVTLTGLDDASDYFIAIKAKASGGQLSANYSNEVKGWPRIRPDAIPVQSVPPGTTWTVVLTGANFKAPLTANLLPQTAGAAIPCAATVSDPTHLSVSCVVPATAPAGARVLQLSGESYAEASGITLGPVVMIGDVSNARRADSLRP